MPSDLSMPPTEAPTPSPTPAGMPEGIPAPTGGGSVMMQMPKDAFDSIRDIVMQLASALEQAGSQVDSEAAQAEMGAAEGMPPEKVPAEMASADEQDLAMFAQELNNRGK